MKTPILALTAALMLASGAATTASAEPGYYDSHGYYHEKDDSNLFHDNGRYVYRIHYYDNDRDVVRYDDDDYYQSDRQLRLAVGAYLPPEYYGDAFYVDYEPYGLSPTAYGYRWNRVGDDAYLIATDTGLIISVRYDAFR